MKKGRVNAKYEEKYIKANRTFPVGKTILLLFIIAIQIGMVIAAFHFEPQPQDKIQQYDVTVEALADGSLDIHYSFVWKALDTSKELTWIEIGMANEHYSVYPDSVSDTIRKYRHENDDGFVRLVLDLDRPYIGGDVLKFSFKINQKNMLCKDSEGYFYEFVPGWFNATPVEHYTFKWADDGKIKSGTDAIRQDGYYIRSGSFECGGYAKMHIRYGQESFDGCATIPYKPFDDSGTYNDLQEDKDAMIALSVIGAVLLIIVQVWIVDSVVSYHRGRGFLTGHGYHIHTYGRSNPYYIRARDRYNATHAGRSGGRSGGGCACACACACAGGGRAGCSQKDTYYKKSAT